MQETKVCRAAELILQMCTMIVMAQHRFCIRLMVMILFDLFPN
jgi:hypothetical protein